MVMIRASNLSSAKRKAKKKIENRSDWMKGYKVCSVVPVKRKITDGTKQKYYEAYVSKNKRCPKKEILDWKKSIKKAFP